MTIVSHGYAIDGVMGISLCDSDVPMQWARAFVADTGDSDSGDREMLGGDVHDLAAVAGGVVQADDVGHGLYPSMQKPMMPQARRHTRQASRRWPPGALDDCRSVFAIVQARHTATHGASVRRL